MLDGELLGRLHSAWLNQGAPVAHAVRDGLSESELQRIASEAGLVLPDEAVRWWSWHDGVAPDAGPSARELGPGLKYLALEEAVQERDRLREIARDGYGAGPENPWRDSWLPIVGRRESIVIECRVPKTSPVPVRMFFFEDPSAGARGVESIGTLVSLWIAAMESGAWQYNRGRNGWDYDMEAVDPDVRDLGLV